jgi:hypothetical protein
MTSNDQPASPAPRQDALSEQTTAAGVDAAALVARAAIVKDGSIAALRDEARDHGRMPFKVRDMHVMALHNAFRDLFAALDTLTRAQAEQQAEIARLTGINSKLCNNHNELLIDGTKWQHRAEAVAAERDALKAERDTLAQENATLRQQVGDWRFRYEQTEPSEGA